MKEPEIVLEEYSPHGNLYAVVEQDDRVAYLYLKAPSNEAFGLKTCWIRNLGEAPDQLDYESMNVGVPPMLPKSFCKDPAGAEALRAESLQLVWFPEGDGIALLENGRYLAVIPPWGGMDGFDGYARDCLGQSPLAWGLEDTSVMDERIQQAIDYWAQWDRSPSPWEVCQDAFMAVYEQALGPHKRYFAIDGGNWPARALVLFENSDKVYLLTLGISLRPQPAVEMHYEDPMDYRRFEFAACFSKEISEETILAFASYLSAQATLPWNQFTFFGDGHTVLCDSLANDASLKDFNSVLLKENPIDAPDIQTPRTQGEKVSLLWAIPLTAEERNFSESHSSKDLCALFPSATPSCVIAERKRVI
ncbi:suppressor of fused domain protein [Cerasicoccus frondis]|uniref:suppressor of fused domain protein n=1 Tax=Cerasicoccus frondis TaxID=490090 RepID=UPI002852A021|nr:suppressor of fused domain protein [Cerasicoccus frondis]